MSPIRCHCQSNVPLNCFTCPWPSLSGIRSVLGTYWLFKKHKHSKQICSKIQIDCCYGFFAQSPATPQNDALTQKTDLYTLKLKARRGHAVQQNIANQHCANASRLPERINNFKERLELPLGTSALARWPLGRNPSEGLKEGLIDKREQRGERANARRRKNQAVTLNITTREKRKRRHRQHTDNTTDIFCTEPSRSHTH